jgi:hypothetical protein
MPEFTLLGSLHPFVIATAGNALLIEGPLFTAGKINKNGWGIPEEEAADFAASFTGKPIRYCPYGKEVIPGVPGEHYCDAINSQKAVVGTILKVMPGGKDDQNRTVFYQRAKITDPATVKGIQSGTIPLTVSLWGIADEHGEDGMMRGIRGESASIVSDPAYTEARFTWMAAKSYPFQSSKGASTVTDKPTEEQATLPGMEAVAPGVTINIAAGKGSTDGKDGGGSPEHNAVCAGCGEKLPAYAKFCPACGKGLHAACGGCGASVRPGAKFCEACGTPVGQTVGDNSVAASVDKQVAEKLAAKLEEVRKQDLAASIVQVQIRAGLLKQEDAEKRKTELVTIPAAALEIELANYTTIADKLAKPDERGLKSGQIPVPASTQEKPKLPMPANADAFLARFKGLDNKGLTWEDVKKYGPGGTFHQGRVIQEV